MKLPDFTTSNHQANWERFCNLMWFDEQLGFWLDISRMKINNNDFDNYYEQFKKSFYSMQEIENGSIANEAESRQVGHYWLRNPSIAPNLDVSNHLREQISSIEKFGSDIIQGKIKNHNNELFTDVIWIGIGGSALGPLLLVDSLRKTGLGLEFHFLDNVDTDGISRIINNLSNRLATTLVVVVSKSGSTPEPKLCMDQIRNAYEKYSLDWNSNAIAITMIDSQLDKLASRENWLRRFDLPDWVGGRTSITGAVGLLPISLIGSSVSDFLEGASFMDSLTREKELQNNPAALLAFSWLVAGNAKGHRDMVILPYKDRLQVFSRYLQQLVMESLGKKEDRSGNIVNQGIAVYGNKGSTDQHAYVQQLRDGIDNFFVTFIEVLNDSNDIKPVNNKHPGDYLSGFLQGTRSALTQGGRQHLTITLKEFNEKSLGALIALFERAVGFYAEIVNINAYDQPGVEAGKIAASSILELQNNVEQLLYSGDTFNLKEIQNLIPNSQIESIFWILRHLSTNNPCIQSNGYWGNPDSLTFKYRK